MEDDEAGWIAALIQETMTCARKEKQRSQGLCLFLKQKNDQSALIFSLDFAAASAVSATYLSKRALC